MTAKSLTNVVNDQTVALNALIYGYAGHSLVTPHAALQQIWWTEERINEKVTVDFVRSRLRPEERQRLNRPVGFGDLTDDTYIEWILEKARRLFLILAEIGEAAKIFTVVDKSWDDDDLPLDLEDIEKLSLDNIRDDQAALRFYQTQFTFLLRELREGAHIDYGANEELPLEYVMGLPPAVSLQHWSRVHLPKKPNEVYVRRKCPLGNAESPVAFEMDFIMDVESARMVEHEHIAPVWASYTAKGNGYTLTNFVGQHTLKTFIDHREPPQYKRLQKPERRFLVLNWLHCLADAIATLHQSGFCHSDIRPTNILIDERNNIAFSDIASLETFQKDKKPDAMDAYVYGAPEAHLSPEPVVPAKASAPPPAVGAVRKPSVASKSSSGSSASGGSQRQKLTKVPTNDFTGFNFGFKKNKPKPKPRSRVHETEKADVFSLGCVFLEMITFMLKKKPHEFVKHRSSKQKVNTGGKNSRTDSSFHANLEKIETWIQMLEDFSTEKEDDVFRTVPHILNLVRAMISKAPAGRPSARDVRDRLLDILINYTVMPDIHCAAHKHDIGVATSSTSGSDRASSISTSSLASSSASTLSTASSDADTIRYSTTGTARVSSILNSYSDRSTLAGIAEFGEDSASIVTIEAPTIPTFIDTSYCAPTPPMSPTSSLSPETPDIERTPSPSNATAQYKVKPWNKPFLLLP
ncbi:kinase-like protein [Corynespora cassiicola Philippines]|uniref:EKC/KEOPS complex subunit BUD32 n=1 Tax=Corynespora cassiicola Philippines TaxID=1448308 RepID=A0A2T2P2C3_CORCC|nr:kinase-like protein [Corynespora cassiicola Philippines]